MLPALLLALTPYMCTSIHLNFWSVYSLKFTVLVSAAFKSVLSKSRSSLEPKNFLTGLHPLNSKLNGSEHTQLPLNPLHLLFR